MRGGIVTEGARESLEWLSRTFANMQAMTRAEAELKEFEQLARAQLGAESPLAAAAGQAAAALAQMRTSEQELRETMASRQGFHSPADKDAAVGAGGGGGEFPEPSQPTGEVRGPQGTSEVFAADPSAREADESGGAERGETGGGAVEQPGSEVESPGEATRGTEGSEAGRSGGLGALLSQQAEASRQDGAFYEEFLGQINAGAKERQTAQAAILQALETLANNDAAMQQQIAELRRTLDQLSGQVANLGRPSSQ
jgi:hypothetical protein